MTGNTPTTFTFPAENEADTVELAVTVAQLLKPGDVIALEGDLGAGKTAFARAIINALPGEAEDVPSPTFTLVQTYPREAFDVWHFDLYRLEDPEEAFELGIEDAFVDAVSLIEWPGRLGSLLPNHALEVDICSDASTDHREFQFRGNEDWQSRLSNAAWPTP